MEKYVGRPHIAAGEISIRTILILFMNYIVISGNKFSAAVANTYEILLL